MEGERRKRDSHDHRENESRKVTPNRARQVPPAASKDVSVEFVHAGCDFSASCAFSEYRREMRRSLPVKADSERLELRHDRHRNHPRGAFFMGIITWRRTSAPTKYVVGE